MRWSFALVLVGCGRIAFGPGDPTGDGGLRGGDARGDSVPPMGDAAGFTSMCPVGATAPDPITLQGTVYLAPAGTPLSGVTVDFRRSLGGPIVSTATSDGSGAYSLALPTGGIPVYGYFTLTGATAVPSLVVPTRAYDASTDVDFLVGTQAGIDDAYAAGSETQLASAGSVFLSAMDCAFTPVAGVSFSTTPTTTIVYGDVNGQANGSLTATTAAGVALALNAPLTGVTVTATGGPLALVGGDTPIAQTPTITAYQFYGQ